VPPWRHREKAVMKMKAYQPKAPKFYTIEQIAESLEASTRSIPALDRQWASDRTPDQRGGADFRGGFPDVLGGA
jgi:hypothetical protein